MGPGGHGRITAAAALGGQAIAGLFLGRNQERAEARQRRDRAAEVLAEVRAFLIDASLEVEMANMLHMAGWFVSDLLRGRDSDTAHNQANEYHTAALSLLDRLLDAIHEPEMGRPTGDGLFWRRRELPGRTGGR